MASILIVSGKDRGAYFPLKEAEMIAGRDEACDIQVVDELVSRRHVKLSYNAETKTHQIEDLQSSNGVFVNGRQISEVTELHDADTVKIGESKLFFSEQEFPDMDAAMVAFKKRGEHGKSTLIQ